MEAERITPTICTALPRRTFLREGGKGGCRFPQREAMASPSSTASGPPSPKGEGWGIVRES